MALRADLGLPLGGQVLDDPLERLAVLALLDRPIEAPISSTPYFSSTPSAARFIAQFRAVWPPRVASSASGRSLAITFSTYSGVIGSTYVASANSGSVMIVAGLELTRTTRIPSSRRRGRPGVPE